MELFGLPDWIVFTGTVCVLVYLYASWNRNYWKNQNVVSEPFSFPFGATFKLLFKPMCQLDSERYKQYGRVFGTFEMGNAVLFVGEAKLVEQILVEDFPSLPNRRTLTFNDPVLDNMMSMTPFERWRKIRMPVAQAFSTENVKKMHSLIEDCALITVDHLKKAAFTEEDIDAKKFFGSYTLDVIARCVFATRIDSHLDGKSEFVKRSRQAPSGRLTPRIFVYFLFPFIARATGLRPLSPSVLEYFRRFSQNVIISTQKEEPQGESFVHLFLDHQGNCENTPDSSSERDQRLFNLGSDRKQDTSFYSFKKLNADQAMAQCLLFFIAGQETTSRVISYTLYLLAVHPNVQTKLRKEVDECFAAHGGHPSLEAVTKLKYLHCVISESLRMCPPVSRLERVPCCDYTLGDKGVKVKKGDLITIPVYAMHHDPLYFPDPMSFKPERFNEENVSSIVPYSYLPFGGGPRNCVALRFALLAVNLAVLHTIRNVEVVRTEKTKVPLQFKKGFGLLTAKDIVLGVRPRQ
ncbi:cytochrome P450 3A16 isoform X1 [Rhipicephalus microplus]|uniref:cytochrome P450 3A16 isoform X1 n=2 Tax=Rhipicephalus microplus TaxID=6941 RepID=UPI001888EF8D|nr:cytochrome P450 3A16-like isoform X1 [Rhipicephalus microplus]